MNKVVMAEKTLVEHPLLEHPPAAAGLTRLAENLGRIGQYFAELRCCLLHASYYCILSHPINCALLHRIFDTNGCILLYRSLLHPIAHYIIASYSTCISFYAALLGCYRSIYHIVYNLVITRGRGVGMVR